jgi:hypothetical protein
MHRGRTKTTSTDDGKAALIGAPVDTVRERL